MPSQQSPSSLTSLLSARQEYKPSSRARLAYLYSDLSQARQNNPDSFASSVSWWSNLLHDIASNGLQDAVEDNDRMSADKLVWHCNLEFVDRLRWQGAGKPTGLGTVAVRLPVKSLSNKDRSTHAAFLFCLTPLARIIPDFTAHTPIHLPQFRQADRQQLLLAEMGSQQASRCASLVVDGQARHCG